MAEQMERDHRREISIRFGLTQTLAWLRRPRLSPCQLALLSATFIALSNNLRLFRLLNGRLDLYSVSGLAFAATLCGAIIGVMVFAFLLFGIKYLLKPLIITFVLISSVLSYFAQEWGVIFDEDMLLNIFETYRDHNTQEALELVSPALALHVLLLGVIPSAFIAITQVSYRSFGAEVLRRLAYMGTLLAVVALAFGVNYKFCVFFSRENRDLRCMVIPTYALHSLERYLSSSRGGEDEPFHVLGLDAVQRKSSQTRTVGVLVVGETARADHFSLNGYRRRTNPLLEERRILNYPSVKASGTSTAYSVPCMFSFLGRKEYSPEKAANQSNVLDVLEFAGIDVVWLDNNSSSKGVCDRIGSIRLVAEAKGSTNGDAKDSVFDEALIDAMEQQIDMTKGDVLIVLHTMGSHGPGYHRRYPDQFDVFTPSCRQDAPQQCSDSELINAYDNTLLYTDFVLDQIIERLEQRGKDEAHFLLYLSDHGESLGENGIYLHGLPYFLAPDSQTHVPMLAWLSAEFIDEHSVEYSRLESQVAEDYSHDNLSHSLLGLFDVRTQLYSQDLDLFLAAQGP